MAGNPDAIVIGAGPNGLAAAIEIARAGRKVVVYEARQTIGGGVRSEELTLPGFMHDVCSAVHPLAAASPFFRTLPLAAHGLAWVESPAVLAHPFEDGRAVVVERSVPATAVNLGVDELAYRNLTAPLVRDWPQLEEWVLGPMRWPRRPLLAARFGLQALQPARDLASRLFLTARARGLFAGLAAHGMLPLERRPSAAFGLMLGLLAHAAGWPLPKGGAGSLSNALASYLRELGGEILCGEPVGSVDELPRARAILCDLSPGPLLRIAGHRFPGGFRRKLESYRYGPGVFKLDWALDGPIPWQAAECGRAATVHLGGALDEIAQAEREAWEGRPSERPFVLLVQPALFDSTRAPKGKQTAWAYCHVPRGSAFDMRERIERQVERFAPGFRERILARSAMGPAEMERRNPNYVGGDIGAGAADLRQLLFRPTRRLYSTPVRGLYICSASTPPGPGVHGLCGYHAARRALQETLRE
ncbi:MAG: NAD(P)/FAD-dependent oxidoreductase [Bryobacterales bacterium]|nr:NAD(P)/FAD-dependent oxidoreductase [Bryobacterales bacterium]